jgi:hypothetical protein
MPRKKAVGSLKDVTKKGVAEHKDTEVDYGNVGNMPGGVRNGIAKLTNCGFAKIKSGDNEGEWGFNASAVALEPDTNPNGEKVKGLYTRIFIPVCDTKSRRTGKVTEVNEHIGSILNEMKKLGLNTSEYSSDELEEMAADLQEAQPIFKFTTNQAEGSDRVWENWRGTRGIPDDYEPDSDDGVEDETDEEDEEEVAEKPSRRRKRKSSKKEKEVSDDPMEYIIQ